MSSFRKNFGSGLLYTALSKYSNVFISLAIGAVLARLLSPEEFGIVAIVSVFTIFFGMLSDFGIGPAVIQSNDLDEGDISSIFAFSILFGGVLGGAFFLLAPTIAAFYNETELVNIGRLLSISVLLNSMIIVPKALIRKKLLFKNLGIVNVVVNMVTGVFAIALAYLGFSYYALVFRSILESLIALIIYFWMSPFRVTILIRYKSLMKIARFSTFQFLFNFVNYFSRNLDSILIGKYLSPAALGYYDRSYKLMKLPVQNLTHIFTPVMPAIYASIQNDRNKILDSYTQITKALAIVGFPLSVFLYFGAPEIISIIYGSQWIESIPVFQILAFTIGSQIVMSSTGAIFQSTNRTDLLFVSGLLNSFLMAMGIFYGVFLGESIVAVSYGLLIAFSVNFFLVFFILIHYAFKSSFFSFLKGFIIPVLMSMIMFVPLHLVSGFDWNSMFISITVKSLVALIVFLLTFFLFKSNRNLFKVLVNKKRK